ncbi:aconitase X [Oscillospiraceae bacterium LTW-04]|nr:aconitase X catalytic domain-containing protein [Oscillospiraceae bacterium MB24-C1]
MVRLTPYEQQMLDGKMGAFKQKALEFIVRYAEVLGAEELCEISRATCFIGAQHYLDCYPDDKDYEEIFSEFYLSSDETVPFGTTAPRCKAQTCAACCDIEDHEKTHLPEEFVKKNRRFLEATKKMGISIVDSCTPYYCGWVPMMGEHFVTTESSNVVISNTIYGACGNSDGVEAAVCAAISGRIPKWGMHVPENRFGTCLFHLDFEVHTQMEWDLLGFTLGRLLPKHEVPIIENGLYNIEINNMRQLCAALSVTSAAEICHIVGHTPEARTLEDALGGKEPKYVIHVTERDMQESLAMICDKGSGPVDFVSIGCPHISLDEIQAIASYVKGKHLPAGTELQIWTDYAVKSLATLNGYTKIIEETGASVLTGSCPIVMKEESHKHAKSMVLFGSKQAFGIRHQSSATVYYGEVKRCIDAAYKGRWEEA